MVPRKRDAHTPPLMRVQDPDSFEAMMCNIHESRNSGETSRDTSSFYFPCLPRLFCSWRMGQHRDAETLGLELKNRVECVG